MKPPVKKPDCRARQIPPPRILSLMDVERKLGQQITDDAIAAGWLKHRCEKVTSVRQKPRRLFALDDVEAVEDRILCGEYPQPKGGATS
ncbi:MAG: hypothetical protein V4726_05835 [Verrucomicrobiota bacterium]